jgi:hypothetical protein|nr:MAG TPA: hypothetical protein [Caudoviricetes sp.]
MLAATIIHCDRHHATGDLGQHEVAAAAIKQSIEELLKPYSWFSYFELKVIQHNEPRRFTLIGECTVELKEDEIITSHDFMDFLKSRRDEIHPDILDRIKAFFQLWEHTHIVDPKVYHAELTQTALFKYRDCPQLGQKADRIRIPFVSHVHRKMLDVLGPSEALHNAIQGFKDIKIRFIETGFTISYKRTAQELLQHDEEETLFRLKHIVEIVDQTLVSLELLDIIFTPRR